MINSSNLTEKVTFQIQEGEAWRDLLTVYASMTGLRNSEYWEQYAGGNADECVTISIRYKPELASLIPQVSRILHGGNIYDIISPPDDVLFRHKEIKFRARRQIS